MVKHLSMRRCIPIFISFMHKLAVLEQFSFSRFSMRTRVKRETEKRSKTANLMKVGIQRRID